MFFGNAAVEEPCRILHLEVIKARAERHCSRDCNDLGVLCGKLRHCIGKNGCIARLRGTYACLQVKRSDAVIIGRISLRGSIALALLGNDMDKYRSPDLLCTVESLNEIFHVVSVNRSVVIEA